MNTLYRPLIIVVIFLSLSLISYGQENLIRYGDQVEGNLDTDTGTWEFLGGEGHSVSIGVSSTEIDTIVQLYATDGTLLVEDDNGGKGTNSLIRDFILPTEETYSITVLSADNSSGSYTLSLTSPNQSLTPVYEAFQFEYFTVIEVDELSIDTIAEVYVEDEGLSLRAEPAIADNLLGKIPAGTPVTIIDGPVDSSGYTWWKVRLPYPLSAEGDTLGWSVESADSIQTLIPKKKLVSQNEPACHSIDVPQDLLVEELPLVYREDMLLVFNNLELDKQTILDLGLGSQGQQLQSFNLTWSSDGMLTIFKIPPDIEGLTAFVTVNLLQQEVCKFQIRSAALASSGFNWSPDTHEVVFSLYDALYILDADSYVFRQLEVPEAARLPIWSPTGERIAFGVFDNDYMFAGFSSQGLYTINVDGTDLTHYFADVEIFASAGRDIDRSLRWSPDGTMILGETLIYSNTPSEPEVTLFRLDDETYHIVPSAKNSEAIWLEDSTGFFHYTLDQIMLYDIASDANTIIKTFDVGEHDSGRCFGKWDNQIVYQLMKWSDDDENYIFDIDSRDVQETGLNACWIWRD